MDQFSVDIPSPAVIYPEKKGFNLANLIKATDDILEQSSSSDNQAGNSSN